MVIETSNQPISAAGWTDTPNSPQGTASSPGGTRLTTLQRISDGADPTTTTDSGDHQLARIIAIEQGTFDPASPFNTGGCFGSIDGSTNAINIPGGTTTRAECLILQLTSGDLPDLKTGTAEFSGWANANLTGVAELLDNTTSAGDGGAIGGASGVLVAAGAVGNMTATAVNAAVRGYICLAIQPPGAAANPRVRIVRHRTIRRRV